MTAAITAARANSALDDITGGIGSSGRLKIYAGSVPATVDDSAGTELADLALNTTAFAAATEVGTTASATMNTASAVEDTSATATGTAAYARFETSGGTAIIQVSVGTSGEDINLDSVSITAGDIVRVTSFTLTLSQIGS